MKMKKLVTLMLTAAMAAGVCGAFAACTDGEEKTEGETVTITCLDASATLAEKEVPYNPQRVAILDYAVLDMMDLYGVGDRVVSSARGTLAYLQTYWTKMDNNQIVDLGNLQSYDMDKLMQSEPDIIFIGGRQSGNYAAFEEIAPVVYLSVTAGNVVEETLANAKTVAKIFGVSDAKVEEVESGLRPRIAALRALSFADDEAAETKTAMVLMYTSETSISALASNGRCSLISSELGFELKSASTGSGSGSGNGGNGGGSGNGGNGGGSGGAGGQHGSSLSFETIATVNPDYIFILNRGYITSNGENGNDQVVSTFDNDVINATKAGQNGNIIVMENPDAWYTAEGGLQALVTMVSDLEKAFGIGA